MDFGKLFQGTCLESARVPGKMSGGDIPSLHINRRMLVLLNAHWHPINATFLGFHMRNRLGPGSVPFSKSFPLQAPVPVHNGLQY